MDEISLIIYYLVVINVINFLLLGIDKYLAISELRRIPEKVFWLVAIVGGSLGGIMGMEIFKHKRRKTGFVLVMLVIALIQAGIIYAYIAS